MGQEALDSHRGVDGCLEVDKLIIPFFSAGALELSKSRLLGVHDDAGLDAESLFGGEGRVAVKDEAGDVGQRNLVLDGCASLEDVDTVRVVAGQFHPVTLVPHGERSCNTPIKHVDKRFLEL